MNMSTCLAAYGSCICIISYSLDGRSSTQQRAAISRRLDNISALVPWPFETRFEELLSDHRFIYITWTSYYSHVQWLGRLSLMFATICADCRSLPSQFQLTHQSQGCCSTPHSCEYRGWLAVRSPTFRICHVHGPSLTMTQCVALHTTTAPTRSATFCICNMPRWHDF